MVSFSARASDLWKIVSINQKIEDKDEGYQRTLSASRVRRIKQYIEGGNALPTSILVSFDRFTLSEDGLTLTVPNHTGAGWVIDGQHRLAGAHEANKPIDLPVIAFLGLDVDEQIFQFVTINKEAKGVPTSLYYDLLKHLPPEKKPAEVAKEKAADIAKPTQARRRFALLWANRRYEISKKRRDVAHQLCTQGLSLSR